MNLKSTGQKIGKYVKYQREKRMLSLREFAEKTKLTPSYLSRLESGEYRNVTLHVIEKLASGFEIPVNEFLRKCQIMAPHRSELPELGYYLREKYQLPTQAVEDMSMFFSFIQKKYQKEIHSLQAKHNQYWRS